MARRVAPIDTRRKPVAGYPSQAAACAALAERGLSPDEIGRKIGRDAYHVRAILRRMSHGARPRSFVLPARFALALANEARARGTDAVELATELLDAIVRDELFDALLGEPGNADA